MDGEPFPLTLSRGGGGAPVVCYCAPAALRWQKLAARAGARLELGGSLGSRAFRGETGALLVNGRPMVSQGARGISRLLLLLCCLPVAPAIGGKQVQLLLGPMLLKRNMEGFVTNCLDCKSELVAAARRTHPIQKKRSPGECFWARFRS